MSIIIDDYEKKSIFNGEDEPCKSNLMQSLNLTQIKIEDLYLKIKISFAVEFLKEA